MVSTHPCSSFKPNKMCSSSSRTLSRAFLEVNEHLLSVPTFMTAYLTVGTIQTMLGQTPKTASRHVCMYVFNWRVAGLQKQLEWHKIALCKVSRHMQLQTPLSLMHYFHKTENSALVRRQHDTSTFGQVFTAKWLAENRTVKYKTPSVWRRLVERNVTW
jgi:hypothetical protein